MKKQQDGLPGITYGIAEGSMSVFDDKTTIKTLQIISTTGDTIYYNSFSLGDRAVI